MLKVLKLSAQGLPQSWISLEQAVTHYAADEVRWEAGVEIAVYRGGYNAITGLQSKIVINSIIGTKGVPRINPFDLKPGLTNSKLFARDRNLCAYCGDDFHETDLTREHIIPFGQHGQDSWMNVVTACKTCNHRKANRTPEQARMPLLYAPYTPSLWEDFIFAQSPHIGRSNGIFDGAFAAQFEVGGLSPIVQALQTSLDGFGINHMLLREHPRGQAVRRVVWQHRNHGLFKDRAMVEFGGD
jgi:hypothetical protein